MKPEALIILYKFEFVYTYNKTLKKQNIVQLWRMEITK